MVQSGRLRIGWDGAIMSLIEAQEPVYILTESQLKTIMATASAPLLSRVDGIEERLSLDIALDRQRLTRLECGQVEPRHKDRAEIIRALLVANGGKMRLKDARKLMRISKSEFSKTLSTCSDFIETRPSRRDRRSKILILKS